MTSLWVQTQTGSVTNEFWYMDYMEHIVHKSTKRPKYQSVTKWSGTIQSFLESKNMPYVTESKNIIHFEQNS